MPAYLDLLVGQVLDESGDGCLVSPGAPVEVIEVERQGSGSVLPDLALMKGTAQDPVSGAGEDEDAVVRALSPLQLSVGRGISIDQVDESVPIHHAYVMSLLAFPCGEGEFLAVLPVSVGYELTGEITVDDDGDLSGEVRLGIRTELLDHLLAVLSNDPFAIHEDFAGEAEGLLAQSMNPAVAGFEVHEASPCVGTLRNGDGARIRALEFRGWIPDGW
ncbi:hypothetical protein ACN6AT_05930 [Streptomyces sp. JL4002]|uniref:hypothetical protein n=1 Tax=Streptomyces sp. JL4002 TaxID=3404781 RepID=UPI003B2866CA